MAESDFNLVVIARRTHVAHLLGFGQIHHNISLSCVLTNNLTGVDLHVRINEKLFLYPEDCSVYKE